MLELKNIQGGYTQGSMVLHGINLVIKPRETVGIIGLNGCGKSTLGKAIMNILPFRKGDLSFHGKNISSLSPHGLRDNGITMVMQGGRIFKNMTIGEHFRIAANEKNELKLKKKVEEVENLIGLAKFTVENRWQQKGSYLSGGEKQQLVLLMALLQEPELLILDEISAGLSPANLEMTLNVIAHIKKYSNLSIMLIEQNLRLAAKLSNRLLLLERGIIDQEFVIDNNFDIKILNVNIFN
jgi:ABC-type branched-subunit amino acid transport system ATPase component